MPTTLKIIFTLMLLLVVIFGITAWSFWEPSGFTKGSVAYHLKLPSSVKAVKAIQPVAESLYTYRIADGTQPMIIRRDYRSRLSITDFLRDSVLRGFSCENFSVDNHAVCEHRDEIGRIQTLIIRYPSPDDLVEVEHFFVDF